MAEGHRAATLPEAWRAATETEARRTSLPAERLWETLARADAEVELDFGRDWARLLDALAGALERRAHTPSEAAGLLRREWVEIARLAAAVEGEELPAGIEERVRQAAHDATEEAGVRAIAKGLRRAAEECAARGQLGPLAEWTWTLPEPPAPEPPKPKPARVAPRESARVAPPPLSAPVPMPSPAPTPSPAAEPPAWSPPAHLEAGALLLVLRPSLKRDFLERQLAACGLPVRSADNAEEAMRSLSQGRFRAVLVEPALMAPGLAPWIEHAGASRVVWLVAESAAGPRGTEDVLVVPPSDEEIERLRLST